MKCKGNLAKVGFYFAGGAKVGVTVYTQDPSLSTTAEENHRHFFPCLCKSPTTVNQAYQV